MDVVFQRLDLTDPKSVDDVREFIAQNYGRLDVLVNNAAICFNDPTLYGKCAHTPFERQADITVTTNFFGTLGVTRALLPLLRAAPSPRVINIASAAGRLSILRSQEKAAAFSSPAVEIDEIAGLMTEFVADVESGVHAEKVKERGSKWGKERRKNGGRTMEGGNGLFAVLTPPPPPPPPPPSAAPLPVCARTPRTPRRRPPPQGWANTCYGMSKLGIIAMTRALARDEPAVLVSSVDPGYCATDQNANRGTLSAVQGAQTPVALALLPAPSSSSPASSEFRSGAHFFYDGSEIDWLRS
jgi:NAD(P)-dependent dehydrogenase (short-subunit alcohol dehydrogenase family)